jgi:hypothetical protein
LPVNAEVHAISRGGRGLPRPAPDAPRELDRRADERVRMIGDATEGQSRGRAVALRRSANPDEARAEILDDLSRKVDILSEGSNVACPPPSQDYVAAKLLIFSPRNGCQAQVSSGTRVTRCCAVLRTLALLTELPRGTPIFSETQSRFGRGRSRSLEHRPLGRHAPRCCGFGCCLYTRMPRSRRRLRRR